MIDDIDLRDLSPRESERTEWKQNVADIDDVVATLSAFANDLANLGGGYVVCGAREDADEHGFPRLVRDGLTAARVREVERTVLARCRDRVAPALSPTVHELAADAPDRRVLVFMQPATARAHTFRRGREGARHYVRRGRATEEARNGVLLDLLTRKSEIEPWDRRPCPGATVADIDLLALRDALQRMRRVDDAPRVEDLLRESVQLSAFVPSLCVVEPLTGVLRPRNFTALLFGRSPSRFVPGAVAIFSRYPGVDRAEPTAQRHEIAGTLIEQALRLRDLLDAEVVTLFDKTDLEHPNAETYPRRALHEAMINALAHRDYGAVDPTRLTAFADRVEMVSPGPLPRGVSIEALREGSVSALWRNQTLAWFFEKLGLAQNEGQGIRTIQRTLAANGCPPPEFTADEVRVTCVLHAHPRASRPGRGSGRTAAGRAPD